MEVQVEIISSEMIKPSSPTPHKFSHYILSGLDQYFQFTYVPLVLFYQPTPSHYEITTTVNRLKVSLSRSLSVFYPFAGRLTADESAIECNDKGISFVVARAVGCSLMAFLDSPNRVDFVGLFLSKNIYDHNNNTTTTTNNNNNNFNVTRLIPIAIQVTMFDCGGIVISSQYLHKVIDGATIGSFLKTWASLAAERNENAAIIPDFETGRSLFPPRNINILQPVGRKVRTLVPLDDNEAAQVVDGLCIVKTFIFTSEAISALRAKGSSDQVPKPTRIEAVSGFIWKHAMSAAAAVARASSSSLAMAGTFAITHALNMRPRFDPPLKSSTVGNLFIDTMAHYEGTGHTMVGETEPNFQELVCLIQKSLQMAKSAEFLQKFQGEEGGEVFCNYKLKLAELLGNSNVITHKFTSWGGLDMNPDFGFGAPIWAGVTGGRLSYLFKNLIILMETSNGGIEAWLILDEQEMINLENDKDFLEFASHFAGKLLPLGN